MSVKQGFSLAFFIGVFLGADLQFDDSTGSSSWAMPKDKLTALSKAEGCVCPHFSNLAFIIAEGRQSLDTSAFLFFVETWRLWLLKISPWPSPVLRIRFKDKERELLTEIFSWQLLDGILNSVWFFVSFTRSLFRYIPVRALIEGVKEKKTGFLSYLPR